jgi:predicted O-methyltransferase YrrM
MNQMLENVFSSKKFLKKNGEWIDIHSETSRDQCLFLQKIISDNKFSNSIEIGFAHGMSALAITEEVSKNNGKHLIIDKFEISNWNSIGLDIIEQAELSSFIEYHEEYCYEILPKLYQNGRKFDFAYIDSTKQLDWLLVNFFYIDRMLELNGVIVFDDVTFPSIRKLLRYISQFPEYKVYDTYPKNNKSHLAFQFLSFFKKLPFSKKILNEKIVLPDYKLGINTNCVALQKIGNDIRKWNWHKDF